MHSPILLFPHSCNIWTCVNVGAAVSTHVYLFPSGGIGVRCMCCMHSRSEINMGFMPEHRGEKPHLLLVHTHVRTLLCLTCRHDTVALLLLV